MSSVEGRPADDADRSSERRELSLVLALTLIGGGGLIWITGRAWFGVTIPRQPPFGALVTEVTGRHLFPALNGLAIVAVLIAVLVLVTGGWARRALGVLLLVIGVWSGWYAVRGIAKRYYGLNDLLGDKLSQLDGTVQLRHHVAWAYLSLLCSVLLVVAAVVLVTRAGRWKFGLSSRYQAPVEVAKSGDPWRSLDRGEDPTILDR